MACRDIEYDNIFHLKSVDYILKHIQHVKPFQPIILI